MHARRFFLVVPTALVAVAGLACLTSAAASNGGFGGAPQVAQATPPVAPPDCLAQDEFSHDVPFRHPDGFWVVYECT